MPLASKLDLASSNVNGYLLPTMEEHDLQRKGEYSSEYSPFGTGREDVVVWGYDELSFALSSTDAGVLQSAASLFRFWRMETVLQQSTFTRRWRIETEGETEFQEDGKMRFCRLYEEDRDDVPFRGPLWRALAIIEFYCVHTLLDLSRAMSLHGALVGGKANHSGAGVLIVGPSESGKSTLSSALWRDGWDLLCDDATFLENAPDHSVRARPVPRRVSLRAGSRQLLGEALWEHLLDAPSSVRTSEGLLFMPDEIEPNRSLRTSATMSQIPLAAIVMLARRDAEVEAGELRRLNAAQAAIALLPYSNLAIKMPYFDALRQAIALTESIPVFDFGRAAPADMVAQVNTLLESLLG